jgi:hypothetical protein
VGPRAGLDVCEKSRHHRDSIPGPSSQIKFHLAIFSEMHIVISLKIVTAGVSNAVHDTVTQRITIRIFTDTRIAHLMHMYFVMPSDIVMGCIFSF